MRGTFPVFGHITKICDGTITDCRRLEILQSVLMVLLLFGETLSSIYQSSIVLLPNRLHSIYNMDQVYTEYQCLVILLSYSMALCMIAEEQKFSSFHNIPSSSVYCLNRLNFICRSTLPMFLVTLRSYAHLRASRNDLRQLCNEVGYLLSGLSPCRYHVKQSEPASAQCHFSSVQQCAIVQI